MNTIYYVTNFMGYLAGFLCVAMICFSIIKIMTGDEGEHRKYHSRMKYGMIALILIISIGSIKNMILTYFPYVQSNDAIGDFSEIQVSLTDGALNEEKKDCQGRSVIRVDGNYYVNTGEKLINIGGFWDQYKVWCSVYKLYDDCQGLTKGAMADDIYYMSWENTKLKGESKGFLMSAEVKGTIKDDNDFKDLMGNWLTEKYQQYEWVS